MRSRAHRRRQARPREDADGSRASLRLRQRDPVGAPRRRHAARHRRTLLRAGAKRRSRRAASTSTRWPSSRSRTGQRLPFVLTFFPSHQSPPLPIDPFASMPTRCAPGKRGVRNAPTRASGAARSALAHHAQEPHLCADRRHRRRPHDVAAGTGGRAAQLGLSLLLGARFDVHALCAAARRLSRRSVGVARLAVALRRRATRRSADSVRRRRRPRARGSSRCPGYPVTRTRGRCASAMRHRSSFSSTSTAN